MKNFCAGIHILIRKENKYLLLRRSSNDKENPDNWDLPGGGIDFGEQPFDAAIRESKEEAGVDIRTKDILAYWAVTYEDKWSIETIVSAQYLSGDIKLSKEHSDYQWVDKLGLKNIESKSDNLKALFLHKIKEY